MNIRMVFAIPTVVVPIQMLIFKACTTSTIGE